MNNKIYYPTVVVESPISSVTSLCNVVTTAQSETGAAELRETVKYYVKYLLKFTNISCINTFNCTDTIMLKDSVLRFGYSHRE